MTFTLAVCGPSASGKSTLAKELCAALRRDGCIVELLQQDEYFLLAKPLSYWSIDPAHDTPHAIDMRRLRGDLRRAKEAAAEAAREAGSSADFQSAHEHTEGQSTRCSSCAGSLVVVEGFLLLQDDELMGDVDAILFLQASREACLDRRLTRSKRTPHESEGCRRYFLETVWPMYEYYTVPALAAVLGLSSDGGVGAGISCSADLAKALDTSGVAVAGSTDRSGDATQGIVLARKKSPRPISILDSVQSGAGHVLQAALAELGRVAPPSVAVSAFAARQLLALETALTASDWSRLVEILPAVVVESRDAPTVREKLALTVAPHAAAMLRGSLPVEFTRRDGVGGASVEASDKEGHWRLESSPWARGQMTVLGAFISASPGPPRLLAAAATALTLILRVLRNCCAAGEAVQLAMLRTGVLAAAETLASAAVASAEEASTGVSAGGAAPAAKYGAVEVDSLSGRTSASHSEDDGLASTEACYACALAGMQLIANSAVQNEAVQEALWARGPAVLEAVFKPLKPEDCDARSAHLTLNVAPGEARAATATTDRSAPGDHTPTAIQPMSPGFVAGMAGVGPPQPCATSMQPSLRAQHMLLSVGLSILFSCVRGRPDRLRALLGGGNADRGTDQAQDGTGRATNSEALPGWGSSNLSFSSRLGWLRGCLVLAGSNVADPTWSLLILSATVAAGLLPPMLAATSEIDDGDASNSSTAGTAGGVSTEPIRARERLCLTVAFLAEQAPRLDADFAVGGGAHIASELASVLPCASERGWWQGNFGGQQGQTDTQSQPRAAMTADAKLAPPSECIQLASLLRACCALAARSETPFSDFDDDSSALTLTPLLLHTLSTMAQWRPPQGLSAPAPTFAADVPAGALRAAETGGPGTTTTVSSADGNADKRMGGRVQGGSALGGGPSTRPQASDLETFEVEREIVRLLALLAHRRPAVQELVARLGGMATVLQRCQVDERNPFIREWALLAVRNLTEGCVANQDTIRNLQQLSKPSIRL